MCVFGFSCFTDQIDLSGLPIDVALRKFQSFFRMPVRRSTSCRPSDSIFHARCTNLVTCVIKSSSFQLCNLVNVCIKKDDEALEEGGLTMRRSREYLPCWIV